MAVGSNFGMPPPQIQHGRPRLDAALRGLLISILHWLHGFFPACGAWVITSMSAGIVEISAV